VVFSSRRAGVFDADFAGFCAAGAVDGAVALAVPAVLLRASAVLRSCSASAALSSRT
jgi:hypothetical protein